MNRISSLTCAVGVVASLGLATPLGGARPASGATVPAPVRQEAAPAAGARGLPLSFEQNCGQAFPDARFVVRDGLITALVCGAETVFGLLAPPPRGSGAAGDSPDPVGARREVVRMRFLGADAAARVEGREPLPGTSNYFTGSDPAGWITGIPTFDGCAVRRVLPGVDLVWHGDAAGHLTYDLVVAPGADAGSIAFTLDGTRSTSVAPDGSLRATTALGELRQSRPVAFQFVAGTRQAVRVAFSTGPDGAVRFDLGAYDRGRELVIDPSLSYATYLGGTSGEIAYAGAVDGSGAAYVTGFTTSLDFPTQSPLQTTASGSFEAFVTKISAGGASIAYSTYLGGAGEDRGYAVAVDASGNAYVAGKTTSAGFPVVNAAQSAIGGSADAFVAKLSASGSSLAYSTFIGGGGDECAISAGIAVDSTGAAYVTGGTSSTNFPVQSAAQSSAGGGGDAFVTKVGAAGSSFAYSTYVGGSASDWGTGIAVDSSGAAYLTGCTRSSDFPTLSSFQSAYGGGGWTDGFVTKIASSGSSFAYSSFLGGTGSDGGNGIAVDSSGAAYVAGQTDSTDFPLQSPYQGTHGGGVNDAFVAKVGTQGSTLVYSTYLGGSSNDWGTGIAVNGAGEAVVAGHTASSDFPVAFPTQASLGGQIDIFLTQFGASGSALAFSTYLGGSSAEFARGLGLTSGVACVAGQSNSTDFPVRSAVQPSFAGGSGYDAIVATYAVGTGGGTASPPAAPTDLVATYTRGIGVSLSWTDSSQGETGFRVERVPQGYSYSHLVTTPADTTTYTDVNLYPCTTYTYRVRAVGTGGSSAWSNEASIVTDKVPPIPPPPGGPSQLRATALDDTTVQLTWVDNSADEVRFHLQRADGGEALKSLTFPRANVVSMTDEAARPGWPYRYRVAAVALQGPSPWSNVASVTLPATLDVRLGSARLAVSSKPRHSTLRAVAHYEPLPTATTAALDPVANGVNLQLGFATLPLSISVPPDDAGWRIKVTKARRGRPSVVARATWRSAKGAVPRKTVVVDLVHRSISVSVAGFDLVGAGGPPMRVLVACGPDGGGHEADWPETKRGVFVYTAK
jgi:hypothetical protein